MSSQHFHPQIISVIAELQTRQAPWMSQVTRAANATAMLKMLKMLKMLNKKGLEEIIRCLPDSLV
ncbi:hypothetical protein AVO28_11970 [Yersinia pestis]|nr:hypothetical protein AUL40_11365 [Yersinia pestis]KZC72810.1 hypothetical protein AVO28_11970 [Yersinia pestis]